MMIQPEYFVAAPKQLDHGPSLLTPKEKQRITHEWNDTTVDFGLPQTIHAMFEQQAAKTPDAVALLTSDQQLTFSQLNTRANRLAHYLISLGVQPTTFVAVMMDRSIEAVVALLAILKAGGAYIPIDPNYPSERVAFMLSDCGTQFLLKQTHAPLAPFYIPQVICIDDIAAELAQRSGENPSVAVSPQDLAYVIYTSGSTGFPKGVMATHSNVFNRFNWMWLTYPFKEGEVLCHKTSFAFVDSVWEIWGGILKGFPLSILPAWLVQEPARLVAVLAAQKVTRLVLVPSLLRILLESNVIQQQHLPCLNHWVCSGEVLTSQLSQRFFRVRPGSILLNLYGSSEVMGDVTSYRVPNKLDLPFSTVPIGRPISNMRVYILNDKQQPIPIGRVGELYVGGKQLARGYLNQPALTAERFIDHSKFGRLYKTGDLCRWKPDGNIEYIGRIDFQVKIRGFRIELQEIENTLLAQANVREAVVVAHDYNDDKRLVAYVVGEIKIDTLRQQIEQKLPNYMVPATFIILDAMPLTPNGKCNRLALPAPNFELNHANFEPPASDIERQLAEIWEQVLGIATIGRHDSFFHLGGHSLLATQIISRLQNQFHIDLPIRILFEAKTIAGLAQAIELASTIRIDAVYTSEFDEEF